MSLQISSHCGVGETSFKLDLRVWQMLGSLPVNILSKSYGLTQHPSGRCRLLQKKLPCSNASTERTSRPQLQRGRRPRGHSEREKPRLRSFQVATFQALVKQCPTLVIDLLSQVGVLMIYIILHGWRAVTGPRIPIPRCSHPGWQVVAAFRLAG